MAIVNPPLHWGFLNRKAFSNINDKTIFKDLAEHRVHTLEEISNELDLSKSVVNESLNNLIHVGLVLPLSTSGAGSVVFSPSIEGLKLIRAGIDASGNINDYY